LKTPWARDKAEAAVFPKFPVANVSLRKRLWTIIVLVAGYLAYVSLADLIPGFRNFFGQRSFERSVLTLGFVVILIISLSGLAASGKLAALAIKDGLTGLFNQSYIKARLQEEIDRSERYQHPLSIMLLDIDDFKSINDQYGHVTGDHILRDFSNSLRDSLRSSDIAGRYGGEEFLIILPQTACLDAAAAAERIRKLTRQYAFKVEKRRERTCQISISIGVYSSPYSGQSFEEIINAADAALSRAKKEGKNRVVVFIR
jgi:diguanylate cyclase (GGDEF)-like protein